MQINKNMNNSFENPFANYGRAISGKDFIGRAIQIKEFESKVIFPKDSGNLALIGFPRIGKTSIAEQTILKYHDYLLQNKKIPIQINIGTISETYAFFKLLVSKTYEFFEENNVVNELLLKYANLVREHHNSWETLKGHVERFFEKVNTAGYRVIFFIDEFDYARIIFKDQFYSFQELRELGYRSTFKVSFVTTSRRSIRDIEIYCIGGSNLDLIFKKEYISMFDDNDIADYYNKIEIVGIQLNETHKQRIEYYCGRHPYLLTVLGFEIVESYRNNQTSDIDIIFKKIQLDFIDYYNQLINLLKEDNSFTNLLQIIFGPQITITEPDINELLTYGMIKPSEKYFTTYSLHFQGYLKLKVKDEKIDIETWKLISLTEKGLRNFIHSVLSNKFNNDWINELPKKYESESDKGKQAKRKWLLELIKRLETQRTDYINLYGSLGNLNLLDYTYLDELYQLIKAEWNDIFGAIFGKTTNYWDECFKLIAKVRNPVYHQNPEVFPSSIYQKVDEYCTELLEILEKNKFA